MKPAKENKKDATMWIMDFLIGVLWIGSIWLCYAYMKQALVAPDINHCVHCALGKGTDEKGEK